MKPAPARLPPSPRRDRRHGARRWLGRLGLAGFTFFLVKGLLWLLVPSLLVALGIGC